MLFRSEVRSAKARSDREFVYDRLITTRAELDSAQTRLLQFQRDNSAIDLDKQRDLAINAASDIKSQLALTQVELDVKKQTYSDDHPDVMQLSRKVGELKKQMTLLETGTGTTSSLTLPLSDIPELSLRSAELHAEVGLQENVLGLLTEMYEEARIKEQKDTPTIAVLETAYPPEIKYRPQRSIIVITTFAASLILAIFIALFADYLENLRRTSPADFDLLNQARDRLTGKTGISDS